MRLGTMARVKSLEKKVQDNVRFQSGSLPDDYFSDWSTDDLRLVANCPESEPFPEHIEAKLRKDGII